jgi:hypothetical protein
MIDYLIVNIYIFIIMKIEIFYLFLLLLIIKYELKYPKIKI